MFAEQTASQSFLHRLISSSNTNVNETQQRHSKGEFLSSSDPVESVTRREALSTYDLPSYMPEFGILCCGTMMSLLFVFWHFVLWQTFSVSCVRNERLLSEKCDRKILSHGHSAIPLAAYHLLTSTHGTSTTKFTIVQNSRRRKRSLEPSSQIVWIK